MRNNRRSGIAARTKRSGGATRGGIAARQNAVYVPLPASTKKLVLERDNYTCQDCTKSLSEYPYLILTVDHIIPQSRGGSNRPTNLKTRCVDCHSFKKTGSADKKGARLLQGMKKHVQKQKEQKRTSTKVARGESWKDHVG